MKNKINFIGCGRLGMSIAKCIQLSQVADIQDIYTQSEASCARAIEFIGAGERCQTLEALRPADIYFIATPDAAIESVCINLAENKHFKKGAVVAHFSGALSSDILSSAKKLDCAVASLHPVKSFADPDATVANFTGTYCSLEGDMAANTVLSTLFQSIGAVVFPIQAEMKMKYHLSMAMANNYLTTLHFHAFEQLCQTGIDEHIAHALISDLMEDALSNIQSHDHQHALTGPIQRGDLNTIRGHLNALDAGSYAQSLYTLLGIGTLPITQLTSSEKKAMLDLLNECS